MREVLAALFDVFLGPENHPIILHMGEQTSAHGEAVKGKKDHEYGPPHVRAFGGALKRLKGQSHEAPAQGGSISKELHGKLQRAYEEYNQWSVTKKCELVLCCKVEKVFQKGSKKMTFAFRDPAFRQVILDAFEVIQGLTMKQGRAPQ
eukprot:8748627-Pyramimonas_sp.AAC.1